MNILNRLCQWLATGRCIFPGTPVSSTNKTDRHDIADILLKVVWDIITLALPGLVSIGRDFGEADWNVKYYGWSQGKRMQMDGNSLNDISDQVSELKTNNQQQKNGNNNFQI